MTRITPFTIGLMATSAKSLDEETREEVISWLNENSEAVISIGLDEVTRLFQSENGEIDEDVELELYRRMSARERQEYRLKTINGLAKAVSANLQAMAVLHSIQTTLSSLARKALGGLLAAL